MSDKYTVSIFYSPDDEGWIANIPEFVMCSAFGNTPEEALHEVLIARDAILEDILEQKQEDK